MLNNRLIAGPETGLVLFDDVDLPARQAVRYEQRELSGPASTGFQICEIQKKKPMISSADDDDRWKTKG